MVTKEELLKILDQNQQTKAIIKYAQKKKILYFSPQTEEIQVPEKNSQYPVYYREGFVAEDVTGFWTPGSLLTYIQSNYEGYKTGLEFGWLKAFKYLSLTFPWSGWAWVIDSTETIRNDLVDDFISSKPRHEQSKYYSQYSDLCKAITEEEIYKHLNENYLKVKEHFWVATNDVSCIVYDPKSKPYDLKDGWSTIQLGEILSEWLEILTGEKIPAKYRQGSW